MLNEQKMTNFEQLVLSDAKQKRDLQMAELNIQKEQMIQQSVKTLTESYEKNLKRAMDKIVSEKNERLIHKQIEHKQDLLNMREGYINKIFGDVNERLLQYIKTPQYESYVTDLILKVKKNLSGETVLQISSNDEILIKVSKALNIEAIFSEEDFIGGFLLIDEQNHIRIDETFKTKLELSRDKFLETHNLQL